MNQIINKRKNSFNNSKFNIISNLLAALVVIIFVIWMLRNPENLNQISREDGPIEYLSALFMMLSGIGFFVIAIKNHFISSRLFNRKKVFLLLWCIIMIVFAGEEISWGQRIFNFSTPESMIDINKQGEFNIHNLGFIGKFRYRFLTLFILSVGVLFPILTYSKKIKKLIQRIYFPVSPIAYIVIFIGSFLYGKFLYEYANTGDTATEVREFFLALGMLCFSLHGILKPKDIFRINE